MFVIAYISQMIITCKLLHVDCTSLEVQIHRTMIQIQFSDLQNETLKSCLFVTMHAITDSLRALSASTYYQYVSCLQLANSTWHCTQKTATQYCVLQIINNSCPMQCVRRLHISFLGYMYLQLAATTIDLTIDTRLFIYLSCNIDLTLVGFLI